MPRIVELANSLEADIRERRLSPGAPYFSLAETAQMLGVSTATANRALQLLAKRNILTRAQRRGTFISSLQRTPSPGKLKRVFMLVNRSYLSQEGLIADGVLVGIHEQLPGADVQFNFLPATDPTEYIDRLINEILRLKEPAGLVMTKVPFLVQRAVQASGLPAVMNGSLYPSIEGMAWVEQDNRAIAKLIADYALGRNCRHVAVLARDQMFPGDDVVTQELNRLLGDAGFKAGDCSVCHLPDDRAAVQAAVKELVQRYPYGLCLVCRSEIKVEGAHAAVELLKLKGRRRPLLVLTGLHSRPGDENPYPYIFPTMRPEEIGAAIGRLLVAQVTQPNAAPGHIVIPVELAVPVAAGKLLSA